MNHSAYCLRQIQPGQRFVLLRTMEAYTLVRRDHDTPGGTRYVVKRDGRDHESTLHHSCHVALAQEAHNYEQGSRT